MGWERKDVRRMNLAVNSLKGRVNMYAGVSRLNSERLKGPLKSLVHASAPGKKISKIGIALFWVPEPTMISNAVALPMIAGGKLLDRYYTGMTLKHVGEETRKNMSSLEEFFR
jgi:hypothetical protein